LVDSELPSIVDGLGQLTFGGQSTQNVSNISITPDAQGNAVLNYTPPSFFLRASAQKSDWGKAERAVNIVVHQEGVGTTVQGLTLHRPPVFLLHGLGGQIDAFDAFQPLVPSVCTDPIFCARLSFPAQYYVPRQGFDGRFDLFNIGSNRTRKHVVDEVKDVKAEIAQSLNGSDAAHAYLPGFAVGKIDLVAHSMGGLISREMLTDPLISGAVRKLILINSPLRGTPIADKVVAIRNELLLDLDKLDAVSPEDVLHPRVPDLLDLTAGPLFRQAVNVSACNMAIKLGGLTPYLNIYNGAVDDLQTALVDENGNDTEVGRLKKDLDANGTRVPTHHVVTTTADAELAATPFGEVGKLWNIVARLCNWTPDHTTVERTRAEKAAIEAGVVLAGGELLGEVTELFGLEHHAVEGIPFVENEAQLVESAHSLTELNNTVAEAHFPDSLPFLGEDAEVIFQEPSDRVVPMSSQLEGQSLGGLSITQVRGIVDHQQAKITPELRPSTCIAKSPDGRPLPQFNAPGNNFISVDRDANGNPQQTPALACQIMNLLELDPKSRYFTQP
jgi:pimeloyl-ACP methyl ester carboxylesterase